jgi:hypothetical protein
MTFGSHLILTLNFNFTNLSKPLKTLILGFTLSLQFIFTLLGQHFKLYYLFKYIVLPSSLIAGFLALRLDDYRVVTYGLRFLLGFNIVSIWYKSVNRIYYYLDPITLVIALIFIMFSDLTISRMFTIFTLLSFSYLIIIGLDMVISSFVKYPIDWNLPVWECLLTYLVAGLAYRYHLNAFEGGLEYSNDNNPNHRINNGTNREDNANEETMPILNDSNLNYQALSNNSNTINIDQTEE